MWKGLKFCCTSKAEWELECMKLSARAERRPQKLEQENLCPLLASLKEEREWKRRQKRGKKRIGEPNKKLCRWAWSCTSLENKSKLWREVTDLQSLQQPLQSLQRQLQTLSLRMNNGQWKIRCLCVFVMQNGQLLLPFLEHSWKAFSINTW